MSERTKIKWCDHSWSPWRGCTKVSPGYAHCYDETLSKRNPAVLGGCGNGRPRVLAKNWKDPVKWNRIARWGACARCKSTRDPLSTGNCRSCGEVDRTFTRPRVFPSLCDWLDDEVPIEWLVRFLQLIHDTQNLTWLLLTKRPENWYRRMYEALLHSEGITDPNLTEQDPETEVGEMLNDWLRLDLLHAPKNVLIGTSVEDQQRANERIPELLKIPAKLRFLSVEPLLAPVDLSKWLNYCHHCDKSGIIRSTDGTHSRCDQNPGLNWVIVGGESGPKARPCNFDWIRSVVRQCADTDVPCFVKQAGAHVLDRNDRGFEGDSGPSGWPMDTMTSETNEPGEYQGKLVRVRLRHPKGGDPVEWPEDLRVRQIPEVKP